MYDKAVGHRGLYGRATSLEFDLTFGDVLPINYSTGLFFNMLRYTLYIIYQPELIQTQFLNFKKNLKFISHLSLIAYHDNLFFSFKTHSVLPLISELSIGQSNGIL